MEINRDFVRLLWFLLVRSWRSRKVWGMESRNYLRRKLTMYFGHDSDSVNKKQDWMLFSGWIYIMLKLKECSNLLCPKDILTQTYDLQAIRKFSISLDVHRLDSWKHFVTILQSWSVNKKTRVQLMTNDEILLFYPQFKLFKSLSNK